MGLGVLVGGSYAGRFSAAARSGGAAGSLRLSCIGSRSRAGARGRRVALRSGSYAARRQRAKGRTPRKRAATRPDSTCDSRSQELGRRMVLPIDRVRQQLAPGPAADPRRVPADAGARYRSLDILGYEARRARTPPATGAGSRRQHLSSSQLGDERTPYVTLRRYSMNAPKGSRRMRVGQETGRTGGLLPTG